MPRATSGRLKPVLDWASRRRFGIVIDPLKVASHHAGVLVSTLVFEMSTARWNKLPQELQALATMASAQEIGCSWCVDFGYWEYHHDGVDPAKLEAVPEWESSSVYSPLERAVIEFAVAATRTPPAVTDELIDRLRDDLDDAQIVELTAWVALENFRSRTNASMGLTSQGFKEHCEVPTDASR